MRERGSGGTAMAILAATAGTGYASGREIALFFGQMGRAGWPGILLAALAFGLLTGLLCRCAARWGADSFPGLCRRMLGRRAAAVAATLYGTLLAVTALMMLYGAGALGALALPLRLSFMWGLAAALLLALLANLARLGPLRWLGAMLAAGGTAFYGALALDPRPVRVHVPGAVELALEDRLPFALPLALAFAGMNACMAAGVAARFGRKARALPVGLESGLAMLALLLCANGALLRGGRQMLFQPLPTVILSARWGIAGFWLCAGFEFLCATATLSAALGGLLDLLRARASRGGEMMLNVPNSP